MIETREPSTSEADLNAARFADFADGLLGVGDKIQKDLNELIGVANNARQFRLGTEINFDAVAAERVFVQLEGAIDNAIEIDGFFLWRSGPGKLEKILDDASGAAGLTVSQFELALGGFGIRLAFAQQFSDAENGSEGIVELVGDAGEHLAHGGEFFRLNELLFEAFEFGDVAAGKDDAFDFSGFVGEGAEIETDAAPVAELVADANFERGVSLASRQNIRK